MENKSYYDGNIFEQVGYAILRFLIVTFSRFIALPWTIFIMKMEDKTLCNKRKRLTFDGKVYNLLEIELNDYY